MAIYTFTDVEFEDGVSVQMDTPWQGVSSISFNGSIPLQGALTWDEGYQFKVDISGKTITLGARRNYGVPIDCEQFFATARDCSNLISYINGATVSASDAVFKFMSQDKVVLFEDPTNHRVYVGLNFTAQDICQPAYKKPTANIV